MKKKGLYQWLHQFGVASSIAMGVWVTTAGAATLNVPSTSTTGVFNVSYTGNSRSHVSFLEVDSDGSLTHIHTDSPAPASSSIAKWWGQVLPFAFLLLALCPCMESSRKSRIIF